jgi:alpha-mannosidase
MKPVYFRAERIKRILKELNDYVHISRQPITSYKMMPCNYGEYNYLDDNTDNWDVFNTGDRWGGRDKHYWFKAKIEIPEEYDGKAVVYEAKTGKDEHWWDAINPQFLVYINKKPVQALDVNHREILLTDCGKAGEIFEIALYAYSGMKESLVELNSSISILDKEAERLYYNIKVPLEVAELLDEEDKRQIDILNYLTEAINIIDFRKPLSPSYYSSIISSNKYLEDEFYNKYCGNEDVIETCVGHTHIDVAWLWTLAQTREKAARSFSTVLNLMKQYPDYVFMSSQPQLYKYVKEDYPDIYEEIKKRIEEGRWETEGSMWLEADCNVTSGESLIRQIIFGKRFFKEEFNVDNKILWLPDVFGYSAALPQILKKTGIDYFMTTKINWSEYNKMPYDTFMWRGVDGSEVLTYFITAKDYEKTSRDLDTTTYNGRLNSSQVMGCWQRYQQKELTNEVLQCFGYGDGGGGATKEMLENAKRLEKGIPGAPKVKIGKSLDFFKRLDTKVRNNKKLPKWIGELYLESHRGTYTSMARNKKYNRKTEFLNLDTELWSTISSSISGNAYPQKSINDIWETTLLNQFHDIIPGSSIKEVYEDSDRDYERINAAAREIVDSAINSIASKMNTDSTSLIVFNQLSFERNDVVTFKLPAGWEDVQIYDCENKIPAQKIENNKVIFFAEKVPAKGYKSFKIEKKEYINQYSSNSAVKGNTTGLSNKYYDIKFDNEGNITQLFDKINNRQVLKANEKGNVLQAFEDKPMDYDAWDINIYYQEKMWEVNEVENIEITEEGPIRACIKVTKRFLDSKIIQNIYIYNNIPRIDFSTWIDWKEKQILLKAAFPVDIHSDKANYEIQYGNVERPTHWNTSWDYAKFEVCAHKWADISEGGYGVSILNDCKYGHDIKDSVMRLTLLKSAVYPNVDADREEHEFTYSLYPHAGDWKEGKVTNSAYELNCPMYTRIEEAHEGSLPAQLSFITIDKDNVIIEVVKKAEASDHIVVRMYEYENKRAMVNCSLLKDIELVEECDMLENKIAALTSEHNKFSFEIKPYEIKTFKLKL